MLEKQKALKLCKNEYERGLVLGHNYLDGVGIMGKNGKSKYYAKVGDRLIERLKENDIIFDIEYGKPNEMSYAFFNFDDPNNKRIRLNKTNNLQQSKRMTKLNEKAQLLGYKTWGRLETAIIRGEIELTITKTGTLLQVSTTD